MMIKFGYRSTALTNITKELVKAGLEDDQILNCLTEVDSYIRKYVDRSDGEQRFQRIINFIRGNEDDK